MSRKSVINKCVVCGSKSLKDTKKDLTLRRKNPGKITIIGQECTECEKCGELYFDERQSAVVAHRIDDAMHLKQHKV
jgi:YgiT-type zinc finger domain-containing protein